MQLTVSGKQVELSDALRAHVSKVLENITHKYFGHALEAHVTFSKTRSFFNCDINLHVGRNIIVRGEGEATDAHAAFDEAAEHIAKRLRRYHRRLTQHTRDHGNRAKSQPGRQYVLRQAPENEPELAAATTSNDEALHAMVIAEAETVIETLSVRDAVMKMDLAFQPVLVFRNVNNGELNVVYRRPDGNVGWIAPETMA
jgi:ribosomal subunit interface protein